MVRTGHYCNKSPRAGKNSGLSSAIRSLRGSPESGLRSQGAKSGTHSLLVAGQDATLQQELESAVADDPELLKWNGILVWFVTRRSVSKDAVADALISNLQNDGAHLEIPVSILLAASSRNDLQRKSY